MADQITEVLEKHIDDLRRSLAMMESGKLRTRTNNEDTTEDSISQNRIWIAKLENALQRHKTRNA